MRRRSKRVLPETSLTVEPGNGLLVAGPNGIGKSTLLRTLAGITHPYAGSVRRPAPPHAYVPEKVALAPAVTVRSWVTDMRRLRTTAADSLDGSLTASGLNPRAPLRLYFSVRRRFSPLCLHKNPYRRNWRTSRTSSCRLPTRSSSSERVLRRPVIPSPVGMKQFRAQRPQPRLTIRVLCL